MPASTEGLHVYPTSRCKRCKACNSSIDLTTTATTPVYSALMETKIHDVVETAWKWADSVVQPAVAEMATLLGLPQPKETETVRSVPNVMLPYFGETPLDVVIFVGSAFVFQCSLWWRQFQYWRQRRRRRRRDDGPDDAQRAQRQQSVPRATSWWEYEPPPPPESKSRVYKPYKDESLHALMGEMMEQKTKLRHVDEDAAILRRHKLREARLDQLVASSSNGLALSQRILQDTRSTLRETGRALDD